MGAYEKRLLRRWVASGHSPGENAGSKYICLTGSESYDFFGGYCMDRELQKTMRGMNQEKRIAYLKEYIGWPDVEYETTGFLPVEE